MRYREDDNDFIAQQIEAMELFTEARSRSEIELEIEKLDRLRNESTQQLIYSEERIQELFNVLQMNQKPAGLHAITCSKKNGILHFNMKGKLPRVGKVIDVKSYQNARNYYLNILKTTLIHNKLAPEEPIEHALIHIKRVNRRGGKRDYDNYFRSFIFDAFVETGYIDDDNTATLKIIENELIGDRNEVEISLIDLTSNSKIVGKHVQELMNYRSESYVQTSLFDS
ncbi:hypothetical protein DH09_00415 (plasmid) [Bacillaceae bacterium JMAK1]|nr:hypothetical protein DH09_00415 [Bacillaceae bacterium JMAK1]